MSGAARQTIVDARGRAVPLRDYRAVVSLVPSLSETVLELGRPLAGRTPYCIHPCPGIEAVPAFRGPRDPDVPGIVAAGADLTLACVDENRAEDLDALEAAGVTVHACDPRSLADVRTLLADYGRLLGAVDEAQARIRQLDLARRLCGRFRKARWSKGFPKAAALVWRDPWLAAGGGTFIEAMMGELGLTNAFAHRPGYPATSLDDLAALNLDLLLLPDEPHPFAAADVAELAAAGIARGASSLLLVSGEALCWYGARTARGLTDLLALDGLRSRHA